MSLSEPPPELPEPPLFPLFTDNPKIDVKSVRLDFDLIKFVNSTFSWNTWIKCKRS